MIFILDDDPGRIEAFKGVLADVPHHIERTVPESIDWLRQHQSDILLYSLDNDLWVPEFRSDPGEGWQLCEWILENAVNKAPMIVHTSNTNAALRMELACNAGGWEYIRVVPYLAHRWISESWLKSVDVVLERISFRIEDK